MAADVSDLARVWPPGQELAIGGQDLDRPVPAGRELATIANKDLARIGKDLAR